MNARAEADITMDRLVPSPVFIFSPMRAGSTLLRCILGSHSHIHAPHELNLPCLIVQVSGFPAPLSIGALGMTTRDLEHLLWDRILHHELIHSGKQVFVDKTPTNVLSWKRIAACWPAAKYIFLIRHPAHIAASLARGFDWAVRTHGQHIAADPIEKVLEFAQAMDEARAELSGPTVRYERLATRPAEVVSELCAFIGVPWEPEMLNYGRFNNRRFIPGLGDWSENIRSGHIQPSPPMPAVEEIPEALKACCYSWGYLDTSIQPASRPVRPTLPVRTE